MTLLAATPSPWCERHPLCLLPCVLCAVAERTAAARTIDRRALPKDGPDIGVDVPGGGAI